MRREQLFSYRSHRMERRVQTNSITNWTDGSRRYDRGSAKVCRDEIRLSAWPVIRLQLLPEQ
jgi:hypothetical protein